MTAQARSTFHWMMTIGAIAGATMSISLAVLSFTQVMIGHGSAEGNILRVAAGALSLFVGILLLIVGGMHWQSSSLAQQREIL